MYFTARINSFFTDKSITLEDVLKKFSKIDGLTHVDLNYPEHFDNISIDGLRRILNENNLKVHGLAMRYRDLSAPVIKCKKVPVKKCSFVAEVNVI